MQTKLCTAIAALGLLSACGAAPPAEPAAADTTTDSPVSVVGTLDVEGMHYSFVTTDQGAGIDIVGPEAAGEPAVFRLMEQYGELTTLEYYLALAPEGAVPDPRLIAAHEAESQALGRPDNAVLRVQLEAPSIVDKGSLQNCKDWTVSKRGGLLHGSLGNTFFDDATLTMAVGTGTTTTIAASVCNTTHSGSDSGLCATVEIKTQTGTDFTQVGSCADFGSAFILPSTGNANPNNTYTHIQGPSSVIRRLRVNGFFLGAGHAYYMAIAF